MIKVVTQKILTSAIFHEAVQSLLKMNPLENELQPLAAGNSGIRPFLFSGHQPSCPLYHNIRHTEHVVAATRQLAYHYSLNEKDAHLQNFIHTHKSMKESVSEPDSPGCPETGSPGSKEKKPIKTPGK